MNYAEIEAGVVVNIIVGRPSASGEYVPIPDGMGVAIGDTYANSAFYAPDGSVRRTQVEQLREDVAAVRAQMDGYEAAYALGVQEA